MSSSTNNNREHNSSRDSGNSNNYSHRSHSPTHHSHYPRKQYTPPHTPPHGSSSGGSGSGGGGGYMGGNNNSSGGNNHRSSNSNSPHSSSSSGSGDSQRQTRNNKQQTYDRRNVPHNNDLKLLMIERTLYVSVNLIGCEVKVQVRDGGWYSGILHSCSVENKFAVILKSARKIAMEDEGKILNFNQVVEVDAPIDTLEIPSSQFVQILAKNINFVDDLVSSKNMLSDSGEFMTDTAISKGSGEVKERELVPWIPDDSSLPLNDSSSKRSSSSSSSSWDQFAINEKKFGVKTTFNFENYTTPLDRNSEQYRSRESEAESIANDILREQSYNPHIAEERGHATGTENDDDEESKYGAVIRDVAVAGSEAAQPPPPPSSSSSSSDNMSGSAASSSSSSSEVDSHIPPSTPSSPANKKVISITTMDGSSWSPSSSPSSPSTSSFTKKSPTPPPTSKPPSPSLPFTMHKSPTSSGGGGGSGGGGYRPSSSSHYPSSHHYHHTTHRGASSSSSAHGFTDFVPSIQQTIILTPKTITYDATVSINQLYCKSMMTPKKDSEVSEVKGKKKEPVKYSPKWPFGSKSLTELLIFLKQSTQEGINQAEYYNQPYLPYRGGAIPFTPYSPYSAPPPYPYYNPMGYVPPSAGYYPTAYVPEYPAYYAAPPNYYPGGGGGGGYYDH